MSNIQQFAEIAKKQDEIVQSVISQKHLTGFQRAHAVANAIQQLREILTAEYMKPIMALQGSKLGFKTDKDLVRKQGGGYEKGPGYRMEVVRDCLIEAVLMGLNPYGNQFNIIGGNTYATKEGCGYLLSKYGINQTIVPALPKVNADKSSAAVDVTIKWTTGDGKNHEVVLPIPIKIDAYTSVDAINGKAKRKARAWLLEQLTGEEVTYDDIEDQEPVYVTNDELHEPKELPPITDTEIRMAIDEGVTLEQMEAKFSLKDGQKLMVTEMLKKG